MKFNANLQTNHQGACTIYAILTFDMIWYICQLQLGKHPVEVVQYTFTHKQYIEQHK